jgi:uncharacterized protein (DUF2147 family)
MNKLIRAGLPVIALALTGAVWAGSTNSPVGTWKTIDDETGKPASLVRVTDDNGVLQGKVEKILREGADPSELCTKCQGALKDQPVVGMTILKGFVRKDSGDEYDGGTVLDPHNGKTYSGTITMIDNGQKLSLRGYIGISLFGRSQTWIRQQ